MQYFAYLLSGTVGYLLGSLCFGIIISKLFMKKDIRTEGSNNAGATNMLRTFGKGPAAAVFIGDFLKAAAAVLLAKYLFSGIDASADRQICAYIAGLCAVLGHMFPVYFRFKGGKGVVTAVAVFVTIEPLVFPFMAVIFFSTLFFFRMVSLASIISAIAYPFVTFGVLFLIKGESPIIPTVFAAIIGILVLIMHRANARRIINEEEPTIGKKK